MANKVNIETEDLLERINKMRDDYATDNKSWLFSSKKYKNDCANKILGSINVERLLSSTVIILPNTHHIFFDYTVFKTYAVPELYETIIQYAISKIYHCINTFGKYEMHINLQSFSVSAFTRYKDIIEMYSNECNTNHTGLHEKIKNMHVYNVPSTIETISQLIGPLLPSLIKDRVIKYDKLSSEKSIKTIMEIISTSHHISYTENTFNET